MSGLFVTFAKSPGMKKITLLLLCTVFTLTLQAARYRVNHVQGTIWDANSPTKELGRVSPGFTFTSDEVKGSKIYLEYKGKRGFIAKYSCIEISGQPTSQTGGTETNAAQDIAEVGPTPESYRSFDDSFDPKILFNALCGLWFFTGLVMAFYLFFDRERCVAYFNKKANAKIAEPISWKNLRPLGFLFFMGIGMQLNGEFGGFISGCIYETILLCFRARHFHSWKAAIIEALYLLLWSGGAVVIVSVAIIAVLFGTQKSQKSNSGTVDECCSNCTYGSRNNDSTCTCRYHNIETSMNSSCNNFSLR